MTKSSLFILAVVSSFLFLSSCISNTNTTSPQVGAFLLAQTSPNAPAPVAVYVNTQLFDTLDFGVATPYISANPGTYTFLVDSFGIATPAKLSSTVTVDANKYYSYFIIDSFNKVKSAWVNDVFKAPSSDSVYVRFFNFCPNSTAPLNLVNSDATVWTQGRTFNDQSNPQFTAFTERAAGTYTLSLQTVSGTALKTQTISLTGGHVYTLYAKGIIGTTDITQSISIGQLENYPQR